MEIARFAEEIARRFTEAEKLGADSISVNAGEVHQAVGGYSSENHSMATCCDAMYREQRDGDHVVSAPPKGKGATLTIKYMLPR